MADTGNVQELNLHGPDAVPHSATGTDADHQALHMKPSVGHLEALVGPGATEEEFVRKLLTVPTEQLIPWEECELPSRGLYYGWPDGKVMVKAMGQQAEKVLANQRLAQSGQSIDYLFNECCRFPLDGFDSASLLLGDRVFLLYFLRGITHGNEYEFMVTCPNCEAASPHTYDLNELGTTIVWADPALGHEPFRVPLPYLSQASGREVWVGVRFLRSVDSIDILAKRRAKKKMTARPGGVRTRGRRPGADPRQQQQANEQIDEAITDNLEKIIVSVMGVPDPMAVRQLIPKLHSQDTAAIRDWLRDHTPGIDNTVSVDCPSCGQTYILEIPISDAFFRSTQSRRDGP